MRSVTFTLLASLVLSLAACEQTIKPAVQHVPPAPRLLVATDQSCKVTLPLEWTEVVKRAAGEENDTSRVLRAGVSSRGPHFTIYRMPKADLADETTYLDEGSASIDRMIKDPDFEEWKVVKGPTKCVVNTRLAVQYEAESITKAKRLKYRYLITVVDGQKSFFYLTGTLHPSQASQYWSALEAITNSFTEMP